MARKPLEPHLWTISETFKHMYSVPIYQRPYSWESVQINMILDDIFRASSLSKTEREEGYFIGSIYVHDRNEKLDGLVQKYEIIDGQQRLTTVSLLLLSIYSLAKQYNISESKETFMDVRRALWKNVGGNYDKQNRTISLSSVESKCFESLYNTCFDKPKKILDFCNRYETKNIFEKRVIDNFKTIYNRVANKFPKEKRLELLEFAYFVLNYVQIIAIDSICSISKAFSIFESINSKGKPLDEIDKIKTYIFSKLDEESYDYYLDLWGKLTIETNDQLYDYLYNYIKAYISFYRQNINVDNFKSLSKDEIKTFFKKKHTADALKALLDDMDLKVKYYKMLTDGEKAYKLVNNNEFRFFYTIFNLINYRHPKPLFLRCLEEYESKKLSKNDLVCIVRETVKFMFEFLTIGNRDSKDAITMFSTIMNDVYVRQGIDKKIVVNIIANEIISKLYSSERIKSSLADMDAYEQNKKIAVALLSLYESTNVNSKGKGKPSYDKAYSLLHDYGRTLSLDHLLVQTPEKKSEFKYYKDEDNKLVLKEGNDFEHDKIISGMEYDQFARLALNRIGNLRLLYKDENSSRQNDILQQESCTKFVTFTQVKEREEKIINTLMDVCLPIPNYDPNMKSISELQENAMPKMKKLIEYGILHTGDKLYITSSPNDSIATLLDGSNVEFEGKKMKIKDWGNKVMGRSITNIYTVVSVVGDDETLQQKRLKYTINNNEDS